ncbi:hypothetical protein BU24DRAFT_140289 [Aaosphaeria arxii CBS 175.79]|uniref:Uncharacterized protein n=1 Tax=Aaosphaeria arxii CBS 175.79 TaxID=1450172 RepID=A0A6A5XW80_9PLEO|nr:uncharacterized protein BU24DRAFT_140289 [Aaosphaeria arxii CBS 175.79]KAF2016890.1 hypothetical protein BU24DRAFT_140289 [Aaosphaeria arxii CBS 175.79]
MCRVLSSIVPLIPRRLHVYEIRLLLRDESRQFPPQADLWPWRGRIWGSGRLSNDALGATIGRRWLDTRGLDLDPWDLIQGLCSVLVDVGVGIIGRMLLRVGISSYSGRRGKFSPLVDHLAGNWERWPLQLIETSKK